MLPAANQTEIGTRRFSAPSGAPLDNEFHCRFSLHLTCSVDMSDSTAAKKPVLSASEAEEAEKAEVKAFLKKVQGSF